jgi:hypothetical protein
MYEPRSLLCCAVGWALPCTALIANRCMSVSVVVAVWIAARLEDCVHSMYVSAAPDTDSSHE